METIVAFVDAYRMVQEVTTITFCGGEVFALEYFPRLMNMMTERKIFVQVITNGTLDELDRIDSPNNVNLIVSLDGLEPLHDANRGEGNFRKSMSFMQKAHRLGFHLDVFSIVHKNNLGLLDQFESMLEKELGFMPTVTYHPRKPPAYLNAHPISNIFGEIQSFDFLTKQEMIELMKTRNVFPPKDLGCYQIAVASDGKVYGCCEGTLPLGTLQNTPSELIGALRTRLDAWSETDTTIGCLGCSQHEFMCGIKEYLIELAKMDK